MQNGHKSIKEHTCRDTADVAVAKAVFTSFRERFTKLAEFALAMSNHCQDKLELIQNLSLEELFCASLHTSLELLRIVSVYFHARRLQCTRAQAQQPIKLKHGALIMM